MKLHDDDDQFKQVINGPQPALIFFHVDWSAKCKTLAAEFEKLAQKHKAEGLAFHTADTDDCTFLAQHEKIHHIPAVRVYHKGGMIDSAEGDKLPAKFEPLVAAALQATTA